MSRLLKRPLASVLAVSLALLLSALAGIAVAKAFTLKVRRHVHVTNNSKSPPTTGAQTIVVNSHGVSLYYLAGETTHHPLCTKADGCFSFWPPYTVGAKAKLSKAAGVPKGKLGLWHRDGFAQLTWKGHPLYRFQPDMDRPGVASGDLLSSFGGTWHVIAAS